MGSDLLIATKHLQLLNLRGAEPKNPLKWPQFSPCSNDCYPKLVSSLKLRFLPSSVRMLKDFVVVGGMDSSLTFFREQLTKEDYFIRADPAMEGKVLCIGYPIYNEIPIIVDSNAGMLLKYIRFTYCR